VSGWAVNAIWVVAGLVAFVLFWFAARALRDLAGRWLVAHHVEADAVTLGRRAVFVTLMLLGAAIALGFAFESANVTIAGIVAATVITSLGVQDVLRNYVSGYYVLLERHIHVGDTIEFDGHTGVIEDIRLRVSLLRAEDGSLVIVPNAQLFNSAVSVLPRAQRPASRRREALRKRAQQDPAEGLESV
jgi:small conductance mechanosensitive channel